MSPAVDFEPIGRRMSSGKGETILGVAQRAGIMLNATCGGEGICGRCIVRVMDGAVTKPNANEENELGEERLVQGWRLACQVEPLGDVRIHIPPESMATAQRTQTEGQNLPIKLAPAIRVETVELREPSLDDLRSDAVRLREGAGIPGLSIALPVLKTLSTDLRELNYKASIWIREATIVGVRPTGTEALGLAVDLGTTKLAAYLVELTSGVTLASAGAMNPQIAYGEDVMARIGHAISVPEGSEQLRAVVLTALNDLAHNLCEQTGRSTEDIAEAVVVGNTAMHHLFLGLPVKQLGLAPYVPAESAELDVSARDAGLKLAPAANVHLLPNIAGFVGADHIAMLLGSGMLEQKGIILGMDIGTNTEISLIAHGHHYTCSTASGPAFEGAHIEHGMRAAPGAIEKALIHNGVLKFQTIDNQPPAGLCGSGILDLVAQLLKAGIITSRGSFNAERAPERIRLGLHGHEYIVVPGVDNAGIEITFSRTDVNEIQLAKGAMRTGVKILLKRAGITENEIDKVVLAGAFGTYLDVQSGIDIGMFPRIEKDKFIQVGNAAGAGARMALLSTKIRKEAVETAQKVTYVELTTEPSFSNLFAKSLLLD